MIIGQILVSELQLYLCFHNYNIVVNRVAYKVCAISMKDLLDLRDDTRFRDEKWWESEHVINITKRTRRILDEKYQKAYLSKSVSDSKHWSYEKKGCHMMY